jgi:hypothetical protein
MFMYYAMSDSNGKWILMKGWLGCQCGQGDIILSGLEEWQLDGVFNSLMKVENTPLALIKKDDE